MPGRRDLPLESVVRRLYYGRMPHGGPRFGRASPPLLGRLLRWVECPLQGRLDGVLRVEVGEVRGRGRRR